MSHSVNPGGYPDPNGYQPQYQTSQYQPQQQAPKKPFYKKVWFWVLVAIVVIIIAVNAGGSKDSGSAAPAPSTSDSTGAPAPAPAPVQDDPLNDDGWTASDIRVEQTEFMLDVNMRVTNGEDSTRSGFFTLTIFQNGSVVATASGAANDVEAGSAASVQLLSSDEVNTSAGELTYELQSEF